MERVVEFLKDAEVFYFKNATATFQAFTPCPVSIDSHAFSITQKSGFGAV